MAAPANSGAQPTKAIITIKKKSGDVTLTCFVNPTEYSISKTNNWSKKEILGSNVPDWTFSGGGSATTSLELLFDTSLEESGEKDVRKRYTNKLWDAMSVDKDNLNSNTGKGEPPKVVFSWGTTWSFQAVITSLSQRFILFQPDGTPIRSIVTVSLTQVVDDTTFARQNPTSGSLPGNIHVVREGDRIDLLAHQYYNKSSLWRYIAEHNDIDNPRKLAPGQRLIIPPLP